MIIGTWNAPARSGKSSDELLVSFAQSREARILVLPAWFDEANRLRRFTMEVMRRLDAAGIDCFMPDLPGCNESLLPLRHQTIDGWRDAAQAAAQQLGATHVLAMRAAALIAPAHLPGWHYAPETGARQLKLMMRAHTIAQREKGIHQTTGTLQVNGRTKGAILAGWEIGPVMFNDLENAQSPAASDRQRAIPADALGASPLWLRAEPSHDPAQADTLAALVREGIIAT